MKDVPEIKYRHELKYIVSAAQIPLLQNRIASVMQLDPHVGAEGKYSIRSLYFDDYANRCFYDNESGTDMREKYRIRIYDHSPCFVNLECKRKERGKTLKTAVQISEAQARQIMDGSGLSWGNIEELDPLLRKMKLKMDMWLLRPKVIVEYDRMPYVCQDGNVRVTFDMNISSCIEWRRFWESQLPRRQVMPPGMHLMEVKYDEFLPDIIYRSLNLGTLRQTAYSKYYYCRKYS